MAKPLFPFSRSPVFSGVGLHLRRAHGSSRGRHQRVRGGGLNPRSASARILAGIREGRFRLIWNQPTRRETEMILRRIPRLEWSKFADLFRAEEFTGSVEPGAFGGIADPDDRKFAALAAAANASLVTNDNLLLAERDRIGVDVLTPRDFLALRQELSTQREDRRDFS
jgi:hypothetical protein